jgi:hypothetical protein
LLAALQFQFLLYTGDSVSNPEWSSCRYILLVANDLIRKTVRGMNAVMALRNLILGQIFVNCLVGRSFATDCFSAQHETLL